MQKPCRKQGSQALTQIKRVTIILKNAVDPVRVFAFPWMIRSESR